MSKINRLRVLWIAAIAVSLGTAMWVNTISVQESLFWWFFVWTVRLFFFLPLFVGSSVQLANTFLVKNNNLWATGLYRYMNVLMGYSYGGDWEGHRAISVCPATWKVGFVATAWGAMFLIWGALAYTAVIFFIDPTLWRSIFIDNHGKNAMIAFLGLFVLAVLKLLFIANAHAMMPQFARAAYFLHLATWAIFALIALVLEPIHTLGMLHYLAAIGAGILIVAAIALIVAILIGCVWLAFKVPAFVAEHTPLSALRDNVNNPFCPTIEEDAREGAESR